MNKNKVVLGALGILIVSALTYSQMQSSVQVKNTVTEKVLVDENQVTSKNYSDTKPSRVGTTDKSINQAAISSDVVDKTKSPKKTSHLAQTHEKPADHMSERQPKSHGHEHTQQHRHPEDNSIIPPGEPKKPLPEQ